MFSFQTAKADDNRFIALTSLTVKEFYEVLPIFSRHMFDFTKEKIRVSSVGGRPQAIKKVEDRLLFILFYLKTYPLQEVMAYSFGISQGTANVLIHKYSDILRLTLKEMGYAPARMTEEMLQRLNGEEQQIYVIDGTERRISRPTDELKQRFFYSGKKRPTRSRIMSLLAKVTEKSST
jgi:hypothetical protein